MQNEGEGTLPYLVLEDRRHVVVSVTRMDDQWQAGSARGGDVSAEALRLRLTWRAAIEIVEPGFADRHHLGMAGKPHQLVGGHVELFRRLVWMSPDRAIHLIVSFSDFKDLLKALHTCRDRHHAADSGLQSAGDDGRPLLGEVRKVEMAMAVDKHQALVSCST